MKEYLVESHIDHHRLLEQYLNEQAHEGYRLVSALALQANPHHVTIILERTKPGTEKEIKWPS